MARKTLHIPATVALFLAMAGISVLILVLTSELHVVAASDDNITWTVTEADHWTTNSATITPTWYLDVLDRRGSYSNMSDQSLVINEADLPHIAYGGNGLYYARFDGNVWITETVDSRTGVGYYASLDLDSNGWPHISYYDSVDDNLQYAFFDGTQWLTQTVDSNDNVGFYTSLAIDAISHPHISYFDDTNNAVKYAYHDGVTWQIETVDSESWSSGGTSLDIDNNGDPAIAYSAWVSTSPVVTELRYACWTGSDWVTQTVSSGTLLGQSVSLDLDNSNWAHISHLHGNDGSVLYTHWTGSAWETSVVDINVGSAAADTTISLGASTTPHVAYFSSINDYLRYAKLMGSNWITETVDSGNKPRWASLALDSNDNPFISFAAQTTGELKFAWKTRERTRASTVPSTGGTLEAYDTAYFSFPAGAFTDTVVMTYTVLQPFGSEPNVGIYFDLTATYASTGQPAQLAPGQSYTVTVYYDDTAIPIGESEVDLGLFYWDGANWLEEMSSLNANANTITATPSHLSVWAVLFGSSHRIYLPLVLRQ